MVDGARHGLVDIADRLGKSKLLWQIASPKWDFDDATFDRTAASFDNPDHVSIVIHNYRWRLGLAEGEPQYAELEKRLAAFPVIAVPTLTLEGDAVTFAIKVNGHTHSVDVDGDTPLLWVLRDVLGMTGTKFGCGMALCGACTVHIDGVATRSCITPVDSISSSAVTTIEAIGATAAGAGIQKAWLDREVVQCGYCQSGQIMSAVALLTSNPHPTDSDIDDAMSGNICRCGTYIRIREAIRQAAQSSGQGG